jgi:hypothetical protein
MALMGKKTRDSPKFGLELYAAMQHIGSQRKRSGGMDQQAAQMAASE